MRSLPSAAVQATVALPPDTYSLRFAGGDIPLFVYSADELTAHPVSKPAYGPTNCDSCCIEPVSPA